MSAKSVAVIGSGISGLSISWLLQKNGYNVSLYEKELSAGGHTLTDESGPEPVDLGFQVYNLTTYPHLVGFFDCLGVDTEPSDMSFALTAEQGQMEWASHGLSSLFAQRRNLFDFRFWKMIVDILRFNHQAPKVLDENVQETYRVMTLGEYISIKGYGEYFKKYYLLPMCAAVWSVPFETTMEFPVCVLVRFWVNHHLLDIVQRPVWRVVKGRSIQYINKVLQELKVVKLGSEVISVTTLDNGKVQVELKDGQREVFDVVVMATHTDTTLDLMKHSLSQEEKDILGAIPYQKNEVYLHRDEGLMPKMKNVWASWNFIGSDNEVGPPCVSYWLNRLQDLGPETPPLFVTLNPPRPPRSNTIFRKINMSHPIFSLASMEAQERLTDIQGRRNIYYCGAWCGYGFHEDGIKSSVLIAEKLGCQLPWIPRVVHPRYTCMDALWLGIFRSFALRSIKVGKLRFILPNGEEMKFGDDDTTPIHGKDWRHGPRLEATVRVLRIEMFKKIVYRSDTGLGEAFMDEDFLVDDLGALMCIFGINAKQLSKNQKSLGLWNRIGEWILVQDAKKRPNSLSGSKDNIRKHYDLGNDMYELFLDDTMTYSCAFFSPESTLRDAQVEKLDRVIRLLKITSTDHVLEVGCGWGSFAIRAAQQTGCRVTGLTLSKEQLKEGRRRIKDAGLEHKVELEYCDYRQWNKIGCYDKLVSIEMIEAVGHENLEIYFISMRQMLKPGGKLYIQAIVVPDDRYRAYSKSSDFIREYIFPGGHLPSLGVLRTLSKQHGLVMDFEEDIGLHYAITLRHWRRNWMQNKDALQALGYDARFHRMFEMYFAYCEGGFEATYIHTFQLTFTKDPERNASLPFVEAPSYVTHMVMGLYLCLIVIMLMRKPYMWIMPISTTSFILGFIFCRKLLDSRHTHCKMSTQGRILRVTSWIEFMYAMVISILSLYHLSTYPLSIEDQDLDLQSLTLYCAPPCVALGFYGYQVGNTVCHRLYEEKPWSLVFYLLMLTFLGYNAYKVQYLLGKMTFSEFQPRLSMLVG